LFLEGEWHWGVKRGQNRERAKKSLVNRLERDLSLERERERSRE
jgi:hypothetical protein